MLDAFVRKDVFGKCVFSVSKAVTHRVGLLRGRYELSSYQDRSITFTRNCFRELAASD